MFEGARHPPLDGFDRNSQSRSDLGVSQTPEARKQENLAVFFGDRADDFLQEEGFVGAVEGVGVGYRLVLMLLADSVTRDAVQGQIGGDAQKERFGRFDSASLVGRDAKIGFLDKVFCVLGTKAKPQTAAEPVAIPSIESS